MALKTENYDVVIVGAGPAGSMLGYCLSRTGTTNIILDKAIFPRKKICAGGLSNKIFKIIPFDISPVIENKINQVDFTCRLKRHFNKSYHSTLIYTVLREKFDNFLLEKARTVGAFFRDNQKIRQITLNNQYVKVDTGQSIIKAKVIVGADGANGIVARTFGLKPFDWIHLALQMQLTNSKNYQDKIVLDFGSIPSGYGWIFPQNSTLSAGVGGLLHKKGQLKNYLFRFVQSVGLQPMPAALSGWLVPHRLSPKPIVYQRAILIGDAAGLTDPWSGEGIFYALQSAQIAAKHVIQFTRGMTNSLMAYQEEVDQTLLSDFQAAYTFSRIFNYTSLLIFEAAKRFDYPMDIFFRIMRGDRTFAQIKKRLRPDMLFKKLLIKSQRNK